MDYREEMKTLRDTLNENARLYYTMDASTMSDYEYDHLYRRLQDLEREHPEEITPDSPTQRVGDKMLNDFAKVEHAVPLESLEDVFNSEEVREFHQGILSTLTDAEYSLEPKVDGLSVAIEYRNGEYYQGATRGDGRTGEDVTENIRTIINLPKSLPDKLPRLIVRGEVYMSKSVFEDLNEQLEINGKQAMANPRNAAAGSLRQKDPKVCAQRRLDVVIFNLQLAEGKTFQTHIETIDYLKSQGFQTIPTCKVNIIDDILNGIDTIGDSRETYPYEIDGAVIKLNDLANRTVLGSTAKCPKWAVAYKYPPEQKKSRLLDIIVQVGRTGVLTPKAMIEPVRLAGTTVTYATLHNQDFITQKDIRIGDTVVVQKAGEIIPEIVEVVKELRPTAAVPYYLPKTCPVCGAPVFRDLDGSAVRCTGAECPAQLLRYLTHFTSRDAMDIDGLGPAVIKQLVEGKLISNAADLYDLTAQDIAQLDRMGIKSAVKAVTAIENSKQNDLWRLIYAFGIRQVGSKAAKVIANHFKTMDAFLAATREDLVCIDDIGEITAGFITEWTGSPQSRDLVERFRNAGLNFTCEAEELDNRFSGMTFVLTGALSKFTREEASELIEKYGGKASGSVSKKTTYVLAGENAGSKLRKAEELGIQIISEDEFLEMTK